MFSISELMLRCTLTYFRVTEDGWNRFPFKRMKTMKTLNVTLAALAIVAASASAALALDGPHNTTLATPNFSDVYAPAASASSVATKQAQPLDATSAATTRLNDAGIAAAQRH